MGLFTAVWGAVSGAVVTLIIFKIIQSYLKGKTMAIVGVIAGGVALWLFATFPTEMLDLFAGLFKTIADWLVAQFKL